MLLTRYLSLYSVGSIFDAHRTLELMPLSTYEYLENKLLSKQLSRSDAAYLNFWLGLQQHYVGKQSAAISSFTSAVAANVATMSWQPLWHLGLSLCKSLVNLMGGKIRVSSEPGAGSTFEFTVKVEVETATAGVTLAAVPVPDARPLPPGVKVLLVDDNVINRKLLDAVFQGEGLSICEVADGLEALAVLKF